MLDLKIDGLDEAMRALEELDRAAQKRVVNAAVARGARLLQREVRARAPSHKPRDVEGRKRHAERLAKYGPLKKNIRVVKKRGELFAYAVTTGRAFWARWLEFGTVKLAPRPFFRPAFDARREAIVKAIATGIGDGLTREAKRLGQRSTIRKR